MSESTVRKFIMTAPFAEVAVLEEVFIARRHAEQEKAKIDAAIDRGLNDIKNGRFYTPNEVDDHIKKYFAELEK
ncbi:MAG: hypothetical protein LBM09_00880 [Candidatus Nomurabacteria bacterium]|nr:hypothetical protein [Candidatus Nomurabacteria bacterium]